MSLDDKNANKKNGDRFVSSRLYYYLNKSHSKREACVAGARNWWVQERTGAREGDTRVALARPFQAPATQAIKVWRAIPDFMKVFLTVLISL